MNDHGGGPAPVDLEARLVALEQQFARLAAELVALRTDLTASGQEPVLVAPAPPHEVRIAPPPAPPPPEPSAAPPPPPQPSAPRLEAPKAPPRRSLGELARDWDLVGARGFAIAGGAVMALGIGLFFVLAANRGWINEEARVVLGATASALVFGAGLLLRARYGQYLAALGAVGAGIAGAYATLAAAAARYDLVPDGLALPLAGVIAGLATAIALRWRSQIIASLGLLGAALAPALQALDTELTWESAAFAVIVLVASASVSTPLGWMELLVSSSVVVGAQVAWLIAEADEPAGAGTIVVAAAFVLVLLGTSVGLQVVHGRLEVDRVALAYALLATGAALLAASVLFEDRVDRGGTLLAAAAVWGLVFAGLQLRRFPDLALVVGAAGLALAAVGTADLVSDAALTLAWSAQAVLLAVLALRLGDVRIQAMSIGYATLAAAHAVSFEARLDLLFDEDADHLAAVLPLAAAAVGFAAGGLLGPDRYVARTESGPLRFVAAFRRLLTTHRAGLREALLYAGALLGTLAVSFALVSASFEWGHVAASVLAAAVGAAILGLSGSLGSDGLAVAAYYWLGVVLAEAVLFDADELSAGGWSAIAAAAGLLAGAYAHRILLPPSPTRDAVCGGAATIAAVACAFGIDELTETRWAGGLGFLAAAAVYVVLAAGVFRRPGFRDVATPLWSLGLLFLIGAESLLVTDVRGWQEVAVIVALTGAGVGVLAQPLRESRLWLAGAAVVGVTTFATISGFTPPSHLFEASETPAEGLWVLLGCIFALAALAVTTPFEHYRLGMYGVAGGVALYAVSLGILDVAEWVSTVSVKTDFERGHTAVSALWALVALALLVAGLLRGSAGVRYGGLALFGLTLAKIFLYDLAELSSVARAFSFIFVGGFLLASGFFLQRLSDRIGAK